MDIKHIAARLRQLAAWYDPATKVQPTFPYGVHEYAREGADRIVALDAHLHAAQRALTIAQGQRLASVATLKDATLDIFIRNNVLPKTAEEAVAYLREFEKVVTGVRLV